MVSDNATEKKIRLGEVASALNVAPKLIRNWTANEKFDLVRGRDHQAEKWRQYSYLDVAHLAIASQAIRYGFSIGEAHDFAGATLVDVLGPLIQRPGSLDRAPAGVLEAICRGKHLYLFKISDGSSFYIVVTPSRELPRYPGAVHIDLEMCVGSAFTGLAELGLDAFSSSKPKEYTKEEAAEFGRLYPQSNAASDEQQDANQRRETVGNLSAGASSPGPQEKDKT